VRQPAWAEAVEPESVAIELADERELVHEAAVVQLLLLEAEVVHRTCRTSLPVDFESHTWGKLSRWIARE